MRNPQVSARAERALAAAQEAARVDSLHIRQKLVRNFSSVLSRLPGLTYIFHSECHYMVDLSPCIDLAVRLVMQYHWPGPPTACFWHWFFSPQQTIHAIAEREKNIALVHEHLSLLRQADIKYSLLWFQEGDVEVRFDFDGKSDEHKAYCKLIDDFADDAYSHITSER